MRHCLTLAVSALLLGAGAAAAGEPKGKDVPKGPIELKVVAGKTTYAWDGDGKTPAEFKKLLDDITEQQKNKGGGPRIPLPKAPTVDLTLQIVNTGKEDVVVYVGGDPNVYTFELKGPGVVTMPNLVAMTADFKLPKLVTLAPGKSYDIPVRQMTDGMRGISRLVYWTEPGEYTLTATYQLSDPQGQRTVLLRSDPIKITVEKK